MKIIFLDIDGTLNRLYKIGSPDFEPRCVQYLNHIIAETGAVIVLSSAWRYKIITGKCTLIEFGKFLKSKGIEGELIDHTRADPNDDHEPRWMQIADWLSKSNNIESYCILDDDAEAFGHRPGILVNARYGLTYQDALDAVEILNNHDLARERAKG